MRRDSERFLERFAAFGAGPGTSSYLALFHPDATLQDAGMERPLTAPEIPARFDLAGGLILSARADFDTLELANALASSRPSRGLSA